MTRQTFDYDSGTLLFNVKHIYSGYDKNMLQDLKYLVVDDEEIIRELIRHMLRGIDGDAAGGKVTSYDSCKTALANIKQNPSYFDLIISDWDVPGLNGLEFLKAAKKITPDTPFVMVTANSTKRLVSRAIEEGVDDYIVKPFTAKCLQDKVNKLIERQQCSLST